MTMLPEKTKKLRDSMTCKKTVTFAAWGSALSFVMAFCAFPLQIFGTGKLAQVLWVTSFCLAAGSVLVLLGCAIGTVGRALWNKTSMEGSLYPCLILFMLFVAWSLFLEFLSKMP